MESLANPEIWIALATLTALELVLGIDNIIFISILAGKLPPEQRDKARQLGIAAAALTRFGLLFAITWIVGLTAPLFTLFDHAFSWRDLILVGGGLFLIGKATHEIHQKLEGASEDVSGSAVRATFTSVVMQIMVLDIVFSLDSVITAVGMAKHVPVMIAAMVIAVIVMMIFAGPVGDFIENHPSVRILALAFLVLIGVMLIAEGTGSHVSKGYVYSSMGFSLFVQILNLRMDARARARGTPP